MSKPSWLPLLAALAAITSSTAACGSASRGSSAVQVAPPPPAAVASRPPAPLQPLPAPADPVAVLIETSQTHFATGQRELHYN